jgi:hypothetical protein
MVRFRHKLPREPALELARLAKVKRSEIEYFCDAVSNTVNEVWQKDRRASSPKRSTGLAWISQTYRCIGVENLRKMLCCNSFSEVQEFPDADRMYAEAV